MSRLRKLAPEYGLDPNQWFKNVQYVVASKVGREPIRYVGNIYKYYLAYRRLREIEAERDPAGRGIDKTLATLVRDALVLFVVYIVPLDLYHSTLLACPARYS